jgi:hypothetical protein
MPQVTAARFLCQLLLGHHTSATGLICGWIVTSVVIGGLSGLEWRSMKELAQRVIANVPAYGLWSVAPTLITSVWLWLYAVSGLVIKLARRLNIGFEWFNRTFDIEKKPLQSIGLVSASLVTLGYWGWAFGHRLLE